MTCPICNADWLDKLTGDMPLDADKHIIRCTHDRLARIEKMLEILTAKPKIGILQKPEAFPPAPPEIVDQHDLPPEERTTPTPTPPERGRVYQIKYIERLPVRRGDALYSFANMSAGFAHLPNHRFIPEHSCVVVADEEAEGPATIRAIFVGINKDLHGPENVEP